MKRVLILYACCVFAVPLLSGCGGVDTSATLEEQAPMGEDEKQRMEQISEQNAANQQRRQGS